MSNTYSEVDLSKVLGDPSPDTMAGVVATTASFMQASRLHSLLSLPSRVNFTPNSVDSLSNALLAVVGTGTPRFTREYRKEAQHVKAGTNLSQYFNSPAKIISCTEPTQLLLAVRCVCDGIFDSILTLAGAGGSDAAVKREVAQRVADAVYENSPFPNDGGSLTNHMARVANFLQWQYRPATSMHVNAWNDNKVRNAVFAAYRPYFVFVFLLSYVPLAGEPRNNARQVTFFEARRAKLCSYLFVMRTVVSLYDRLPAACSNDESCDQLRNFLAQVIDSVAFNILDRENYSVEQAEPEMQSKVRELSKSNRVTSADIVKLNKRYDTYRQNLTSAASAEMQLKRQISTARAWYQFNLSLWLGLLVGLIVLIALPASMLGNMGVGAAYMLCGVGALYALIFALIGAAKAL